ncbi:hypothetical protein ACFWBB_28465 [Streptomyces sp. NPDC060000]|uniref:hypothetical protein n=1 Tax=Streptomyces sp. NPDC060000 TaxID=3347031 RepID=UPI0036B9D741
MRAVRRAVLLCVPAWCALVSCGIPATGVVEAGGPAHGIVPMVRVYLVRAGSLVAVPRRPVTAIDAESAVWSLLEGPTEAERAKRLTTLLPPLTPVPTLDPSVPPSKGADVGPTAVAPTSAPMSVDRRDDGVSIQLHYATDGLADLAMAQLICTAAEAQRTADFTAESVTVTVTDGLGRSVRGTDEHCPDA